MRTCGSTKPPTRCAKPSGVANTLDRHTKALATLSLHGQRLSRQFERTLALLQKLQNERRAEQRQQLEHPVTPLQMPQMKQEFYATAAHGFVFSDDEIEPFPDLEDRAFRASETQNPLPGGRLNRRL